MCPYKGNVQSYASSDCISTEPSASRSQRKEEGRGERVRDVEINANYQQHQCKGVQRERFIIESKMRRRKEGEKAQAPLSCFSIHVIAKANMQNFNK